MLDDLGERGPEHASANSGRDRKYLYAIVPGQQRWTYDSLGIRGRNVYTISDGQLAAVVSDVPYEKIRPERRHLAIHQQVLLRLLKDITPLPVSFGTIAAGPKAIKRILSRNRDALSEQLGRVAGKVEMGLRVAWDVPNIFEYFVNTHAELAAARDLFFGPQRRPTQEDKIEVGRLFDRICNEDRDEYGDKVTRVLSRHCSEVKRNKCRNEREVMNLACLVGREARAGFESDVLEAAGLFDNNFTFAYNGPWTPHSFVDIDLAL